MAKPKVISLIGADKIDNIFLNTAIIGRPADIFIQCASYDLKIPTNVRESSILDIFEETILRMLSVKKCTVSELADVLCLEKDLVNGLIGTVINSPDVAGYNKKTRTFEVIFEPDLTQGVVFNTVGNYDYITSPYDMRNQIKENRYTQGNLFEYAYAITCHVSQGSQFHRVIYIEERMKGDIQSSLNLVGPTRADQQLIYVKPEPFDWRKYNQEKQERAAKIEEQKKLMANTASEYKKQQQIKSKYKNIIYKGN